MSEGKRCLSKHSQGPTREQNDPGVWETEREGKTVLPSPTTTVTTPTRGRRCGSPRVGTAGAPLSSSFRVWEWEAGGQKGGETGPLTPRSLKVQTALMARFGSTHSGGKRSEGYGREPRGPAPLLLSKDRTTKG